MKSRAEAAQYVREQFLRLNSEATTTTKSGRKKSGNTNLGRWHYGKQDLRDLLDFVFDGPPTTAEEMVE